MAASISRKQHTEQERKGAVSSRESMRGGTAGKCQSGGANPLECAGEAPARCVAPTAFKWAHASSYNVQRSIPSAAFRRPCGSDGSALATHSGEWQCSSSKFSRGRCTYRLHPRSKEAPHKVGVASPHKLRTLTALPAKIEEGKPISDHARLRVIATHDFCCAYPPSPTSYGSLPGGEGLKNTVDALRAQGPIVRADAGDFAAPGALATLSGGTAGFAAAADLGIDVGVVGNHEFELGVEHLRTHAPQMGFPLLCANAPRSGCRPQPWSRRIGASWASSG
jgi:hypothetical protein